MTRIVVALVVLIALADSVRAGLYYSGEKIAPLPSKWSGFLVDHRSLRMAGIARPKGGQQAPLREMYLAAAKRLEERAKRQALTAEESADLGALYIRLGQSDKAVEVLRAAARRFSNNFHVAANLGTAWQLSGDLEQAAAALDDAVRLAPAPSRRFEEFHAKLVRLRLKEGKAAAKPESVDDLFGVRFVGESGKPEAGRIAAKEFKKLPADAAAIVQFLALSLPAEGRLIWQLAEIANAHGDVRTAAAILDGCVTEFAMASADLRARRQLYRAATEAFAKSPTSERHKGTFAARSPRPLVRKFDASKLPPIRSDGPNPLPWGLMAGTTVDAEARPMFPEHLSKLDGKTVAIVGFIQPLGDAKEFRGFLLLEYPIGCWFCETPEPTGLISVELAAGTKASARRGPVKVTGVLELNRDNPEDFLFRLKDAKLGEVE